MIPQTEIKKLFYSWIQNKQVKEVESLPRPLVNHLADNQILVIKSDGKKYFYIPSDLVDEFLCYLRVNTGVKIKKTSVKSIGFKMVSDTRHKFVYYKYILPEEEA